MARSSTRKRSAGTDADTDGILPEWAIEFLPGKKYRYKIAYGGRISGKSWTFARMALIRAAMSQIRVLCSRELQNSIQDSVHQLLEDQIHALNLESQFMINESKIVSRCGSEFLFKGLRGMRQNASQLKSLEGVDICWIEEAQTVSQDSITTLFPTIRKQHSEIWITMNPDLATDPIYKFISDPPANALVRKVNWYDNPWFEQTEGPAEREYMLRTDPELYKHVWEGEPRTFTDAQVLNGKYVVEPFTPGEDWDGPYYGADWGFSQDPTVLVECWIHGRRLYVSNEAYAIGVEIDQTPALFKRIEGSTQRTIRADCARPETISYMRRQGFSIVPAKKWPGSVEDGIAHIRGYEQLVIHPRCKHTADEARLYSYKTDRLTGDVLPQIVDKSNHCIDALRYAIDPMIRRKSWRPVA